MTRKAQTKPSKSSRREIGAAAAAASAQNASIPATSGSTVARRSIRSHVEGLSAVMEELGHRTYDLWSVSSAEWEKMSPRQQAELLTHQNQRARLDHDLGPTYFPSDKLQAAVDQAHERYLALTPDQRRGVLHPRHLDVWLGARRIVTIVAPDMPHEEPLPEFALPKSYRLSDDGPQPQWSTRVELTLAIQVDAPLNTVLDHIRNLIGSVYGPPARRPRRGGATRPTREKYADDDVARIIDWYYRFAAGESLKQVAADLSGPMTARHFNAARIRIHRQLHWFRRELGIT